MSNDPAEPKPADRPITPEPARESLGVGDAVTAKRPKPNESEEEISNDMDQPGMDPDGEQMPD